MLSGLENPIHLLILFAIVLLVLGPKRLPEVGRSLGRGIREFKSSISGSDEREAPQVESQVRANDGAPPPA